MKQVCAWFSSILMASAMVVVAEAAQAPAATGAPAAPPLVGDPAANAEDYRIGPQDVINVVFWKDPEMSAEVMVRPDGKISLPLLNDINAAGQTPEQLRQQLVKAATKFVEQPNVSVVVKTVNSRKVYITGMVHRAGAYPMVHPINVLQLIAEAGGLQEYADSKNILIIRKEGDKSTSYRFNFKDVVSRRALDQNITLRPGDTVVVP
jgi:polysaccharide biosynthesis/export protein